MFAVEFAEKEINTERERERMRNAERGVQRDTES